MCGSTQKRRVSLMGVFLLVCLPSLLGAQGQQSSPPSGATTQTAVVTALGGIVAVLISSVAAVMVARTTSRKEIHKATISLEELWPKIDDIKVKGHFVSEGEVLEKLIQCAALDKDRLFPKFRRMVLDTSRVARMIEQSKAEQAETTRRIFREVLGMKPPPEEK